MSVIAVAVRHMMNAGMSADAIAEAVAEMEAEQAPTKSTAAKRQARYRARKAEQAKKASQTVTGDVTGITNVTSVTGDVTPPKEKTPTPPKENTPLSPPKGGHFPPLENEIKGKGDQPSERSQILAHLKTVLDDERALAVIKHRKALKKPLTPHAAKLLAGRMAQAPDANLAADQMIEKGWQSWEPGWGKSQKPRDGPATTSPISSIWKPEWGEQAARNTKRLLEGSGQ